VIRSDASHCQMEVHEWLNRLTGRVDFGRRFERLAHEYRRKGRCKLIHLDPVSPENLLIEQPGADTAERDKNAVEVAA